MGSPVDTRVEMTQRSVRGRSERVSFCFIDGLQYLEEIKFNKCMYIEDACLEKLSSVENLQDSVRALEVVSCGNVTDKGIIALHKLR